MKDYRAFTLIELLIVIAIIAIVAAVVIIALNPLQRFQDARNSQRWQDVTAVVDAVRLYQIDNNGQLPTGLDGNLRMLGTDTSGCGVYCGSTGTDSFVDDSQAEFDSGTYTNTQWDNSNTWLELATGFSNGTYTSNIKDANSVLTSWINLAWNPQRPTYKELPNNGAQETAYNEGNVSMSGNSLLLHLNESSGAVYDSSGQNNNGTAYGGVTYGATGKLNTAISFDGVDDYVEIPHNANLDFTQEYTLEGWVYPDLLRTFEIIFSRGQGDADDIEVYVQSGISFVIAHNRGNGGNFSHVANWDNPPAGQWTHVVITWKDNRWRLYHNGVLKNTSDINNSPLDTDKKWLIGKTEHSAFGATNEFDGRIDEAAFYSRALSVEEIMARYRRGAHSLRYQVRSCDDSACSGETFAGPDGTASTYYSELANSSVGLPTLTLTNLNNNRYFQYQASLGTDNLSYTPEVNSITVNNSGGGGDSTQSSCLNLTSVLTRQLPVIPQDPSQGTAGKTYYAIKRQSSGQIQAKACGAEGGENINISR